MGHPRFNPNSYYQHTARQHYNGGFFGNGWGGGGYRGGFGGFGGYGGGMNASYTKDFGEGKWINVNASANPFVGMFRGFGGGRGGAFVGYQPPPMNAHYYSGPGDRHHGRGYEREVEPETLLEQDYRIGNQRGATGLQQSLGHFAGDAQRLDGRAYDKAEQLLTAVHEAAKGNDYDPRGFFGRSFPHVESRASLTALANALESTHANPYQMKAFEEAWKSAKRVPEYARDEYIQNTMNNFAARNGGEVLGSSYQPQYERPPVGRVPSPEALPPADDSPAAPETRKYIPPTYSGGRKDTVEAAAPTKENLFGAAVLFDGHKDKSEAAFLERVGDYLATQGVDQAKITEIKARTVAAGDIGLSDANSATIVHGLRNALASNDKAAVQELYQALDAVTQSLSSEDVNCGVRANDIAAIQAARDFANGRG